LFFALWPDEGTRHRFEAAAAKLRLSAGARTIPAQNYHLTLAFLGEVEDSQLSALREIGRAQRSGACSIEFDTCEYWHEPRVVVAAARETPAALEELTLRLHRESAPCIALPNRQDTDRPSLRAHVTLARKVAQAPVRQEMSRVLWNASSFTLVRSETHSARSAYTVLDTWPLLYDASAS